MSDGTGDLVLDRLIEQLNECKRERDQCRHITDDTKELDKALKKLLKLIAERERLLSEGHQPPSGSFGRPGLPLIQRIDSDNHGEDGWP